MMLGDMGADIIKVEPPDHGDDTRHWGPPFVGAEAAYFLGVNRNKRSLTLNMAAPAGQKIYRADRKRRPDRRFGSNAGKVGLHQRVVRAVAPRLIRYPLPV
jgi:crotonobetainyl-CoA:carnitine CoA-transferase CaiB-like acyl-CoA transferase